MTDKKKSSESKGLTSVIDRLIKHVRSIAFTESGKESIEDIRSRMVAAVNRVNGIVRSLGFKQSDAVSEEVGKTPHVIVALCGVAVIAFGVWAAVSPLDIVSMTTGQVIPSTQVKTIQHLEGGIVRKILVREGGRVKAGQPLVILEPTTSSADVGELEVRLTSLRIEITRLEAHVKGTEDPTFARNLARNHPSLIKQAVDYFITRKKRHQSDLSRQREATVQRVQEIREITVRINNGKHRLRLLEEQIGISEDLLKQDLTNRYMHLDLLKEASRIKGNVEVDTVAMGRANSALKEAQAVLQNIRDTFDEENRKALDEARLKLGEFTQRMQKFKDSLERTVVRSPVSGTIKSLYVFTVGGVIRSGDPIVDIVPAGDRLIIEAKLPISDIGYVEKGQAVIIKLASADAMRFGSLKGSVINISPDALVTPEGMPFYKVRIETEEDHFERGKQRYNLFPGMQVIANIHTGQRTVLQYVLDPLLRSMDDSMQER